MTTEQILLRARNYAKHDPQFATKAGWLTPYALACGYIQKVDVILYETESKYVMLNKQSGPCYEVCTNLENNYQGWTVYNKLAQARKVFLLLARCLIDEESRQS